MILCAVSACSQTGGICLLSYQGDAHSDSPDIPSARLTRTKSSEDFIRPTSLGSRSENHLSVGLKRTRSRGNSARAGLINQDPTGTGVDSYW